jgi:hypothetical protein
VSIRFNSITRGDVDTLHRLRIELRKGEELEMGFFRARRDARPLDVFGDARIDKSLHVRVVPLRQNELVESALYFDPDTHENLHSIQRTDNWKGEPLRP